MKAQSAKNLIEAALFISDKPMSIQAIKQKLFTQQTITGREISQILQELALDYQDRGINLVKLAQGYRFQTNSSLSKQLSTLYNDRAPKNSQALIETLAIIAYKQPITRSEIEEIRGVAVSSSIIKTLLERSWIKVTGYKEVPGRPSLLGTTVEFLDYFSLTSLAQLPEILPIQDSHTSELITKLETEA